MITQNGIPLASLLLESLVIVFAFYITLRIHVVNRARKKKAVAYLQQAYLFLVFAVISSVSGKYLDYFSSIPQEQLSYSSFTINIAYAFIAGSNVFMYFFIETVFLSNSFHRKLIITMLNGFTVGFIISMNSLEKQAYANLFYVVIYHVLISTYIYGLLVFLSLRSMQHSKMKSAKIGFFTIALNGVFMILVYVFFAIDNYLLNQTGIGYNPEYYLAWLSSFLAVFMGYLGYLMPDWFKKLMGVK